jgi:hypothetical protein
MNNHLVADYGSIRPLRTGPGKVGDIEMSAWLWDDNNLGDVSRAAGAEEREGEDRGKGFHYGNSRRGICGVPRFMRPL